MINHIISKCNKLAQDEYKTRHDRVGKVILRELCKKMKFDHMNKWLVWFGLVICLMAYQLFVGYLMPKLFSKKNSSGTI